MDGSRVSKTSGFWSGPGPRLPAPWPRLSDPNQERTSLGILQVKPALALQQPLVLGDRSPGCHSGLRVGVLASQGPLEVPGEAWRARKLLCCWLTPLKSGVPRPPWPGISEAGPREDDGWGSTALFLAPGEALLLGS